MPLLEESADIAPEMFYSMRIANALAVLLDEKPLERIRVSEICERASVSRQTFYRHFANKYEVPQRYWSYCAEKYLFRVGRELTWHESFVQNFQHAQKNIDFFRIVSKEHGYESSVDFGMRRRIESLEETCSLRGIELTDRLKFQINFFACAESRIIGREVFMASSYHPEEIADLLESCVPRELHDVLDGPAGQPSPRAAGTAL